MKQLLPVTVVLVLATHGVFCSEPRVYHPFHHQLMVHAKRDIQPYPIAFREQRSEASFMQLFKELDRRGMRLISPNDATQRCLYEFKSWVAAQDTQGSLDHHNKLDPAVVGVYAQRIQTAAACNQS